MNVQLIPYFQPRMVKFTNAKSKLYSKIQISVPNLLGQKNMRTFVAHSHCSSPRVFNHGTNSHVSKTWNKSSAELLCKQMFYAARGRTTVFGSVKLSRTYKTVVSICLQQCLFCLFIYKVMWSFCICQQPALITGTEKKNENLKVMLNLVEVEMNLPSSEMTMTLKDQGWASGSSSVSDL